MSLGVLPSSAQQQRSMTQLGFFSGFGFPFLTAKLRFWPAFKVLGTPEKQLL